MQLIDKPQEDRAAQASTMELKTYSRSGSQLGTLTTPQSKVSIFQLPFFGPERDAAIAVQYAGGTKNLFFRKSLLGGSGRLPAPLPVYTCSMSHVHSIARANCNSQRGPPAHTRNNLGKSDIFSCDNLEFPESLSLKQLASSLRSKCDSLQASPRSFAAVSHSDEQNY
jgi:hypothetical protein